MATEFQKIVEALGRESVEFVLIDGVALVVHGSSRSTEDLDLPKRAAGRRKDLLDLAEIQELKKRR